MAQKTTLKLTGTHCAGWDTIETGLKVSRGSILSNTKVNTFLRFEEKAFEYIKSIQLNLTAGNLSEDPVGTDVYVLERPFFSSDTVSIIQNGIKGSTLQYVQSGTKSYDISRDMNVLKYGIMLESAAYPASYTVGNASIIVEHITKETCQLTATNIKPSGDLLDYKIPIDMTWTIQHEGIEVPQKKVEIEWRANGGASSKLTYNTTMGLARIPANTFPQNVTIEYRIRLTSSYGAVGGWSGWHSFKTLLDGRAKVTGITPNATTEQYTGASTIFTFKVNKEDDTVIQQQLEVAFSQDQKTWMTKSDLSNRESYNLPKNELSEGLWYWKARVKTNYGFTLYSAPISFRMFGTPNVTNLIMNGDLWEKPITINWRSEHQVGYEYELYYNNEKVGVGEGKTEKQFVIPAKTFKGTLSASVRMRIYNLVNGKKVYSDWIEQRITLKDIVAVISNLIITGSQWEQPITLSWQSVDQQQFKIEVWKNNEKIKEYLGTTETRYIIPKDTLAAGEYLLKVWVGYANRFVNNQSKNVTLKNIEPSIDKLTLSGSNIDYDLVLSWVSEFQSKAIIEIWQGEKKANEITLATESKYLIEHNTLSIGAYVFKVKVAYISSTGDRWTDFKQLNVTLVESLPSIGALQPDGNIVDKNDAIKCWWTSNNQSKYILTIGDYTYNGMTEKEHIIPPGIFIVGTYNLTLKVIYVTPQGIEKTVTKTSQFIVTGKPNTPTITSSDFFTYSRPVITWDSSEQLGFLCDIEDNTGHLIWSSDWQNGLITRIKCMQYLANGIYRAKVKIMNEFSMESDYAVKQFEVNTYENVEIVLSVSGMPYGKKLRWTNENDVYSAFYIMRNNEVIAKTTQLDYEDYACRHGDNSYIIRGITDKDTYKDSNHVVSRLTLPHGVLATVKAMNDCINCELKRDIYTDQVTYGLNNQVIYLNGREHPIVIIGEHITEDYSIEFVAQDKLAFIHMLERKETFIYRSRDGEVIYLSVTNATVKTDHIGHICSATGQRVDYKEVVGYD